MDQLLSQEAVGEINTMGFLAQVHAPTVTMPRIKAITTGSIPGFVDILLNFGSKELGKRIHWYVYVMMVGSDRANLNQNLSSVISS